jgi:hypothetical protein
MSDTLQCMKCGRKHHWPHSTSFKCGCGYTLTRTDPDLGAAPEGKPKSAADYLGKAQALMIERGKQYDKPEGERSMGKAVMAFNAITGLNIRESEGWLLLQILKDVRQWQNPAFHADSAEDCVAYAALKAEALEQEQA